MRLIGKRILDRTETNVYLDDIWRISDIDEVRGVRFLGIHWFPRYTKIRQKFTPDAIKTSATNDERNEVEVVKVKGFELPNGDKG